MKKILTFLLIVAFLCFGAAWYVLDQVDQWSKVPHTVKAETLVELRPRTSLKQLSHSLEDKGVISDAWKFHAWVRLSGGYEKFQAGTYQFSGDFTPVQVRHKMETGDIYVPLILQVAIPEGFTLRMLNERLATKGVAQMKELNALVRDQSFLKTLGISAPSLEGFTYPATYNFEKMPTAKEFYTRTVKTFFEKLPPHYEDQLREVNLTLPQAVTFASLIELETMQETEKPMIAEVIWSRLKRGEPLGIDAAVIYGIPNYAGDITWAHLKDAKNIYNTRIHHGLPPGAIGAVSRSSLEAVLKPTKLGYYYYMLDATDRTHHVFTRTAKEHNAAVQKYLQSLRGEQLKQKH